MPKATAVWLIDNTMLTFEQIGHFCGLHSLEIQGIADGEVANGIVGRDPISNGELTKEEINRCENNKSEKLGIIKSEVDPVENLLDLNTLLCLKGKIDLMLLHGLQNIIQNYQTHKFVDSSEQQNRQ